MGCGSRGVRCRDRRAWLIPCASASALIILLTLCSSWLSPVGASAKSCTIFTISNGETVLFGNNEDHYDPGTVIEFSPATKTSHGLVRFGFRRDDGSFNLQGVVNDQGLVWDGNGLPPARLNPHPEKAASRHELNCTLDDVLSCSVRCLKPAGTAVLILLAQRRAELEETARRAGLQVTQATLVHSLGEGPPVLIMAALSSASTDAGSPRITRLCIAKQSGADSDLMKAVFEGRWNLSDHPLG